MPAPCHERSVRWARTLSCFAMARAAQGSCTRIARIVAHRSTTAKRKRRASAAATTGGFSTCRVAAWNSRASRRAACGATRSANPGTRSRSAMAWCSPTWGRRTASPSSPAMNALRCWAMANSSTPTIRASAQAGRPSCPATGCSITRTSSTLSMSRSCMAPFPARSSPARWRACPRSCSKPPVTASRSLRDARWRTGGSSIA